MVPDLDAELAALRQVLEDTTTRPAFEVIRSRRRQRSQRIGITAVAIVVACVVAGAAVTARGGLRLAPVTRQPTTGPAGEGFAELARWQQPMGSNCPARIEVVAPDTAIMQPCAESTFTGYDLSNGVQRWTRKLASANLAEFYAAGDVVVLEAQISQQGLSNDGWDTVAVDRLTGAQRWRTDTYTRMVGGMVVSFSGATESATATVHDPNTFADLWSVPDVGSLSITGTDTALWVAKHDGTLTEYDPRSGVKRRSITFSSVRPDEGTPFVRVVGNLLGVLILSPGSDGRESMRTFWYYPANLTQAPIEGRTAGPSDCGPVWCVDRGGATDLIDKETGRIIRRVEFPNQLVGTTVGVLRMATGGDRMGTDVFALVDPLTDAVRVDLTGWRVIIDASSYSCSPNFNPQCFAAGPYLVRSEDGTTQLAALHPDGPHVIGQLPGDVETCSIAPRAIACVVTASSQVGIWRLPA